MTINSLLELNLAIQAFKAASPLDFDDTATVKQVSDCMQYVARWGLVATFEALVQLIPDDIDEDTLENIFSEAVQTDLVRAEEVLAQGFILDILEKTQRQNFAPVIYQHDLLSGIFQPENHPLIKKYFEDIRVAKTFYLNEITDINDQYWVQNIIMCQRNPFEYFSDRQDALDKFNKLVRLHGEPMLLDYLSSFLESSPKKFSKIYQTSIYLKTDKRKELFSQALGKDKFELALKVLRDLHDRDFALEKLFDVIDTFNPNEPYHLDLMLDIVKPLTTEEQCQLLEKIFQSEQVVNILLQFNWRKCFDKLSEFNMQQMHDILTAFYQAKKIDQKPSMNLVQSYLLGQLNFYGVRISSFGQPNEAILGAEVPDHPKFLDYISPAQLSEYSPGALLRFFQENYNGCSIGDDDVNQSYELFKEEATRELEQLLKKQTIEGDSDETKHIFYKVIHTQDDELLENLLTNADILEGIYTEGDFLKFLIRLGTLDQIEQTTQAIQNLQSADYNITELLLECAEYAAENNITDALQWIFDHEQFNAAEFTMANMSLEVAEVFLLHPKMQSQLKYYQEMYSGNIEVYIDDIISLSQSRVLRPHLYVESVNNSLINTIQNNDAPDEGTLQKILVAAISSENFDLIEKAVGSIHKEHQTNILIDVCSGFLNDGDAYEKGYDLLLALFKGAVASKESNLVKKLLEYPAIQNAINQESQAQDMEYHQFVEMFLQLLKINSQTTLDSKTLLQVLHFTVMSSYHGLDLDDGSVKLLLEHPKLEQYQLSILLKQYYDNGKVLDKEKLDSGISLFCEVSEDIRQKLINNNITLGPIEDQCLTLLVYADIKNNTSNDFSNYAGEDKYVAKARRHFDNEAIPYFKDTFATYGDTIEEQLNGIEQEIRERLLNDILEYARSNQLNELEDFVVQNKNNLIRLDPDIAEQTKHYFKDNHVSVFLAWRSSDPAFKSMNFDNLFLMPAAEDADNAVQHTTDSAGLAATKAEASIRARTFAATAYLASIEHIPVSDADPNLITVEGRWGIFVEQLAAIRDVNPSAIPEYDESQVSSDNHYTALDNVICFPGMISQLAISLNNNPNIKIPEEVCEITKIKIKDFICQTYMEFLLDLTQNTDMTNREIAKKMFEYHYAATMIGAKNAEELLFQPGDEREYEESHIELRKKIIDFIRKDGGFIAVLESLVDPADLPSLSESDREQLYHLYFDIEHDKFKRLNDNYEHARKQINTSLTNDLVKVISPILKTLFKEQPDILSQIMQSPEFKSVGHNQLYSTIMINFAHLILKNIDIIDTVAEVNHVTINSVIKQGHKGALAKLFDNPQLINDMVQGFAATQNAQRAEPRRVFVNQQDIKKQVHKKHRSAQKQQVRDDARKPLRKHPIPNRAPKGRGR